MFFLRYRVCTKLLDQSSWVFSLLYQKWQLKQKKKPKTYKLITGTVLRPLYTSIKNYSFTITFP